ncbi:hypothetical protein KJY73_02950 [Bowmanella sp. Y26]|uniref:hypothetical protein n=1 Tax=Bowmanella yangjiangensis TaxID=2811230 RepID=UPI001BDBDF0A|nr:hypothetical protein [Bowmanella yangjiangensis]MBT1062512.1 hypothetical protein [Bowmanella yangjiangensis]
MNTMVSEALWEFVQCLPLPALIANYSKELSYLLSDIPDKDTGGKEPTQTHAIGCEAAHAWDYQITYNNFLFS